MYNSSVVTRLSFGSPRRGERKRDYLLHFYRGRKLIVHARALVRCTRVCVHSSSPTCDGLCSVHLESSPRQRFSTVNRGKRANERTNEQAWFCEANNTPKKPRRRTDTDKARTSTLQTNRDTKRERSPDISKTENFRTWKRRINSRFKRIFYKKKKISFDSILPASARNINQRPF